MCLVGSFEADGIERFSLLSLSFVLFWLLALHYGHSQVGRKEGSFVSWI